MGTCSHSAPIYPFENQRDKASSWEKHGWCQLFSKEVCRSQWVKFFPGLNFRSCLLQHLQSWSSHMFIQYSSHSFSFLVVYLLQGLTSSSEFAVWSGVNWTVVAMQMKSKLLYSAAFCWIDIFWIEEKDENDFFLEGFLYGAFDLLLITHLPAVS